MTEQEMEEKISTKKITQGISLGFSVVVIRFSGPRIYGYL